MNNPYAKFFDPMKIGKMNIKNRLIMSPMGTFTPMQDGTESEEGISYYEERARGGIGMIIIGAMFINEKLAQGSPTIAFNNIRAIPKTSVLVERVHRWGAKICAQLSPGTGRNSVPAPDGRQLLSSSENTEFYNPDKLCRPMTTAEIKECMNDWRAAAEFSKNAGFDAIEIHAHAGYLIDQFMSSIWNKRDDEYGGSFENRMRFPKEIIDTVRSAVGPDMPILFRIAIQHLFQGGRSQEEGLQIIQYLEKCGVDAFDIDVGSYENMDYIFPTSYVGEACMDFVCDAARSAVSVPLINAGNHSPETGLRLVESGKCDFIMFGRQSIADPEFPMKLLENRREDMRPCLICNEECIGRIFGRTTQLSCAVNPRTGFEHYMKIEKTDRPQTILVIGAGPSGLEAARTAALRGHKVIICEKQGQLGGTFKEIATGSFKKRLRELIAWYELQLEKLGVDIRLNTEISIDDSLLEQADKIFVATGSKAIVPAILGIDGPNVLPVTEAHRVGVQGQCIAVCGGGLSGCDTALELAMDQGKEVTIIEMLDECARDVMPINKISLLRLLEENRVKILTGSKVTRIEKDGVSITKEDGAIETIPADTVIAAFGQVPSQDFPNAVRARYNYKTTVIGDAERVSKVGTAIRSGFYAAMAMR